jgi:hypothetical protein
MDPQPTPAPAPGGQPGPAAPGGLPSSPVGETFPRDYVEKLRQEAAEYRTKLKQFEDAQAQAEQQRLAEAGKFEDLARQQATQIKRLEADLAAQQQAILRARIAKKHGIEDFADRLQGATEAELDADAKAFAARLPKATPPAAPGIGAGPVPAPPPSRAQALDDEKKAARASGWSSF